MMCDQFGFVLFDPRTRRACAMPEGIRQLLEQNTGVVVRGVPDHR